MQFLGKPPKSVEELSTSPLVDLSEEFSDSDAVVFPGGRDDFGSGIMFGFFLNTYFPRHYVALLDILETRERITAFLRCEPYKDNDDAR